MCMAIETNLVKHLFIFRRLKGIEGCGKDLQFLIMLTYVYHLFKKRYKYHN